MSHRLSQGSGILAGQGKHLLHGWGRYRYVSGQSCVPWGVHSSVLWIATLDQQTADRTAAAWAKRNGIVCPRVKHWYPPTIPQGGTCPALLPARYLEPRAPVHLGVA